MEISARFNGTLFHIKKEVGVSLIVRHQH